MSKLPRPGLLVTSIGLDGRPNVMTIGWGLVGTMWGERAFMIAIRPSRHTHKLIEEISDFTVNVPTNGMEETIAYCGKVSGRDYDKFKERKLAISDGKRVKSPIIEDCIAHFECKVLGKSRVLPEMLSDDMQKAFYSAGNFNTLYFGKLLSILKNK
ncbi:MAG: hypothetical protein QG670_1040 [Thermoproteota archaeon]|nr:hypothetical protein [Thermoproteota archaeon]